ncbi:hypothetical protein SAMD00019534_109250 [Acytostelium subglobosum LB1]|uniref:hypothetical protein n=1 Tax=Acytostelium subglobosum LB1 TaxID=1410327 RepID=UPI0006449DEE|nr:hypothetical protein SAMD00019534_109250 [Acytostelium subglobosum LB1]GAM27749.1 hypothetical protein SAMD00019534_109250 [Acytostelium subglobosum LB1]|eukprot:XP_012749408.1 hypothetical protein SAMD00019534_109250 [Acytostelium subglobosum LB1]
MTKKRVHTQRSPAVKKEVDQEQQKRDDYQAPDDDVMGSLDKCEHVTKVKVVCIDCKMMLCSLCAVTSHKPHNLDHIDNIKQSITKKKVNDTFDKRLNELWDHMQSLLTTYKTQDNAVKDVVGHYKRLHDALVIEEHMKKKDITLEMERTEETIGRIAKEINDIHSLFNKVGDGECETDTAELMRAATSSKSIAQFVKKIHVNDESGAAAINTDITLLTKFLECNQQMTTNQYQLSRPFSIKTQQYTDTFTGQMRSIIDVIDSKTAWKSSHQMANEIFTFNDDCNCFFRPTTGKFMRYHIDKSKLVRNGVKTSTVYVFGGEG